LGQSTETGDLSRAQDLSLDFKKDKFFKTTSRIIMLRMNYGTYSLTFDKVPCCPLIDNRIIPVTVGLALLGLAKLTFTA
jgi:hypothetical protein